MDFNVIANLHKEKSLLFYSEKDLGNSVIEIEKAIEAIQLM